MGSYAFNLGSFQTSVRPPGLPAPPGTCRTPFSLLVMNLIHSHTAAPLSVLVIPTPEPEPCVPCPFGPFGKSAMPRSKLTRVCPGFLYSEARPGVVLSAASLPCCSNMVVLLSVRNWLSINWNLVEQL